MKSIAYSPIRRNRRHTISTPKEKWVRYRPKRYLYHLTYNRKDKCSAEDLLFFRLSFATEGICGIDKGLGGVWANNQMNRIEKLWPICFDSWGLDKSEYLKFIYQMDVWRIDTTKVGNIWHLDPNLLDDPYARGGEANEYLYCENTVHPSALKLFTLSVNDYRFLYENENLDEFHLNPVDEINKFIHFKWGSKKIA